MPTEFISTEMPNKVPHEWVPSRLGHGEWQCRYCLATNREIAVIGDPNHCPDREKLEYSASRAIRAALENRDADT